MLSWHLPLQSCWTLAGSKWCRQQIPNNLDAATTYTNGKTYFFKGDKYYKFDDDKLEVARSVEYPYPRDSGKWWFGCS